MKILKEEDIIHVMREEWQKKVKSLSEDVDLLLKAKVDGKEINPVDTQLKVRHKKSQILYTVDSVSPQDVVLVTPEGEQFMISGAELEDDYELD
jgi:hypothetical protein